MTLCKQRTFLNCEFMLCALQCLTVRKRFIRCASNFACNVHIDTRWCTRFFNVLGPFLDTERDYLLDGLRTCIGPTDTTVTHKSLNISAFLARRDMWFGMGDFFASP